MDPRENLQSLFDEIPHPPSATKDSDVVRSADLYTLDDGHLKIAKGRTQSELETILKAFNHAFYCYSKGHSSIEFGSLSLLRCEDLISPGFVQRSSSGLLTVPSSSRTRSRASSIRNDMSAKADNENPIDLNQLRRIFDECRKSDSKEFGLSLKKREPHCHWACTRHAPKPGVVKCLKFSYSLVSPDGPSLTISHHFHTLITEQKEILLCTDGELHPGSITLSNSPKQADFLHSPPAPGKVDKGKQNEEFDFRGRNHVEMEAPLPDTCREMARGFTTGLTAAVLKTVLRKASDLELVRRLKQEGEVRTTLRPMLHPKAILLGVLENFEIELRTGIANFQKFINDTAENIKVQRTPENKNSDGLVRCSIDLSESNVRLGLLRPKEQYLAASLAALESCRGIPEGRDLAFLFPPDKASNGSVSTIENPFEDRWTRQLNDINARLLDLKGKCENFKSDLETLQHSVTGNLMMVSNLIAQRENDWTHETAELRLATTNYQSKMLEKQKIILQNQEILAKRAKLDGTVTKWIAVLTAFLLPATFVAILFTVPIFKWDDPQEVWLRPKPFKIYWIATGSLTAAFVAIFLSWFGYLEYRERKTKPDAEDD